MRLPLDYATTCFAMLGKNRVIPYDPAHKWEPAQARRYDQTRAAYAEVFQEPPDPAWWPRQLDIQPTVFLALSEMVPLPLADLTVEGVLRIGFSKFSDASSPEGLVLRHLDSAYPSSPTKLSDPGARRFTAPGFPMLYITSIRAFSAASTSGKVFGFC